MTARSAETGKVLPAIREASAFPVGPATFATAVWVLIYLSWERSGWGSDLFREAFGNIGFMPLNLMSAWLCLRASGQQILDPGVRRALKLYGFGYVAVFIGNVISTSYILLQQKSPDASSLVRILNY